MRSFSFQVERIFCACMCLRHCRLNVELGAVWWQEDKHRCTRWQILFFQESFDIGTGDRGKNFHTTLMDHSDDIITGTRELAASHGVHQEFVRASDISELNVNCRGVVSLTVV